MVAPSASCASIAARSRTTAPSRRVEREAGGVEHVAQHDAGERDGVARVVPGRGPERRGQREDAVSSVANADRRARRWRNCRTCSSRCSGRAATSRAGDRDHHQHHQQRHRRRGQREHHAQHQADQRAVAAPCAPRRSASCRCSPRPSATDSAPSSTTSTAAMARSRGGKRDAGVMPAPAAASRMANRRSPSRAASAGIVRDQHDRDRRTRAVARSSALGPRDRVARRARAVGSSSSSTGGLDQQRAHQGEALPFAGGQAQHRPVEQRRGKAESPASAFARRRGRGNARPRSRPTSPARRRHRRRGGARPGRGTLARARPSRNASPSPGSRSAIRRSSRLLPEPDGPVTATHSPAATSRSNGPARRCAARPVAAAASHPAEMPEQPRVGAQPVVEAAHLELLVRAVHLVVVQPEAEQQAVQPEQAPAGSPPPGSSRRSRSAPPAGRIPRPAPPRRLHEAAVARHLDGAAGAEHVEGELARRRAHARRMNRLNAAMIRVRVLARHEAETHLGAGLRRRSRFSRPARHSRPRCR